MKNKLIKKIGFCTGILLCSVSGISIMRHIAQKHEQNFNQTKVVIDRDTLSIQEFYNNLSYTEKGWVYTKTNGQKYNIDSLCNYQNKEEQKQRVLNKIKLKKQIDTIYVSLPQQEYKNKQKYIYKNGNADSLANMPAMGNYNYDKITIREFKAENPEIQKKLDIYNDKLNCTYDHEYQHFINTQKGLRQWNSYALKFIDCCMDEISVNIKQCLKQRKNYLQNGKDIQYITDRFKFYKEALETKQINPQSEEISQEEKKFIAHGVFDGWMKEKYNIYEKSENSRVKYFLRDAPYIAVQADHAKHQALMKKMFTIDGIDFWSEISEREKEILQRIPPEMTAEWAKLEQLKFSNMEYLERMECLKKTQGENAYNQTLNRNKIITRIISTFGKSR